MFNAFSVIFSISAFSQGAPFDKLRATLGCDVKPLRGYRNRLRVHNLPKERGSKIKSMRVRPRFSLRLVMVVFALVGAGLYLQVVRPGILARRFVGAVS